MRTVNWTEAEISESIQNERCVADVLFEIQAQGMQSISINSQKNPVQEKP